MQATKEVNMPAAMMIYDIFQGTQVRKVDRGDGRVWRVFADCCKALGFKGATNNQLKRIPKLHVDSTDILAKDGKFYKQWIIDELGLIDLIAYSRLPKEQVDAFRELIGQRAMVSVDVFRALLDRVEKLERGGRHLISTYIPPTPPSINLRTKLNIVIRDFVHRQTTDYGHQEAWSELYRQFRDRYHIDLKAKARNVTLKMDRIVTPLDCAEDEGLLQALYDLAVYIFRSLEEA